MTKKADRHHSVGKEMGCMATVTRETVADGGNAQDAFPLATRWHYERVNVVCVDRKVTVAWTPFTTNTRA